MQNKTTETPSYQEKNENVHGLSYSQFWQLQSKFRPLYPYTPVTLDVPIELSSDNDDYIHGIPQENDKGINYGLFHTPLVFPWMNDPTNILYNPDTRLYHRWGLYRSDGGFNSSWVEHVAPSINGPWEQTRNALPKAWLNDGTENGSTLHAGWTGGSAFIDWNGVFGYGPGALIFMVSLSGSGTYNGESFTDQSVAWAYAPAPIGCTNGLGAPIQKGGMIFPKNQTITADLPEGTDWRDCRVVYDCAHNQFVMAISNHNKIQFWHCDIAKGCNNTCCCHSDAVKSGNNTCCCHNPKQYRANIRDWKYLSTFDTGFDIGVECPAFAKIKDSKTGKEVWTLTCGKQIPGGVNPEQSVRIWVGSWDGTEFTPIKNLTSDATVTGACQIEYGAESYAPAMNDPYGYDGQRPLLPSVPDTLYWSTYLGNWSESVWDNPAYAYAGGTWEVRGLHLENLVPMAFPLDTYTDVDYEHAIRLHVGSIIFPVSNVGSNWSSRLTMHQQNELSELEIVFAWSNDNCVKITWKDKAWMIDRQQSGMFTYPDTHNNAMPNPWGKGWTDLIIHYDNSQFVFWDKLNGRVASFWIFPDNLSGQFDDIEPVELKSVQVNPTPVSNVGVDYYFGIAKLPSPNATKRGCCC